MRRPRPTYANVTASLALFVALGGTSYAITKLPKNSVGSTQVRDGSLQRKDLSATAVSRGPRGLEGPTGPVGPAGATGPAGAPGPAAAEGWQALAFVNGWTNYAEGPWENGGYRKDQLGIVHLRGLITKADGAPAGTVAILPLGYRPKRGRIFGVHTGQAPQQIGRIDVYSDGSVQWASGATGEKDYTSLEGISFDTE